MMVDRFQWNYIHLYLKMKLKNLKSKWEMNCLNLEKFKLAISLFSDMVLKNEFDDFLTLPAYKHI